VVDFGGVVFSIWMFSDRFRSGGIREKVNLVMVGARERYMIFSFHF
jgi:hypothetical protein